MTNPYKFTINDIDLAMQATNWCLNNTKYHWDLNTQWPGQGYTFVFQSLDDAAKFVVHCMH